ncbi:dTDP-4-dehydrorhamnose 3,5-epimerase [Gynuella sunshinyii]|uniref:dTDP-4-dehydrorhamnose 3,5-epimerase n=1 Tax=Gynuella sunshinyii YC6258 TaxID=1445510 RepID=A0A0C5VGA4_9GAMM|nr:dTDP-4-dehydrorhamnose 3,5-epimerase [Gynuella sunshinyii]AJQ92448.1 dTDP-4-dehydrorhamnose 3,5-epimerase-related enzyme [Gynuella sunshinyii YC6258]
MQVTPLEINDVKLFEPKVFGDSRGYFYESFNQRVFEQAVGRSVVFGQDNQSSSSKGVLRGLHYQLPDKAQGKLVRVVSGSIFDVAVDIRKSSPTYGQWVGAVLSEENKKQLWIPEGFAHGFLTLSKTAVVLYKATEFYAPELERSIIWNDAELNIQWPADGLTIQVSDKDAQGLSFASAEVFA